MCEIYKEIEELYSMDQQDLQKEAESSKKKVYDYLAKIKDFSPNIHHVRLRMLLFIFLEIEEAEKEVEICLNLDKTLNNIPLRILLFIEIAHLYRKFFISDKATFYYKEALALAEASNDTNNIYNIKLQYGILLCRSELYIEAYKLFIDLLNVKFIGDSKQFFMTLFSWLSVIEATFLNYEKSIEYSLRAINLSLAMKNFLAYAVNNNSLGLTYFIMGKYDFALDAFLSAEKIALEYKNYNLLADVLHNIGLVYKNMCDDENAMQFFMHSLEYREKVQNYANLSITYSSIGDLYLNAGNFEKAEYYYNSALEIRLKYKLTYSLNEIYLDIALLHINKKEYPKAKDILDNVIEHENKQNHAILGRAYQLMGKLYLDTNKYQQALKYAKLNNNETRQIHNNENNQKIRVIKNKYDLELITQESQEKINMEKKKTAIELAIKTKICLENPVKNIKQELQQLNNILIENREFEKYQTYFKKIDNAIQKIEEIMIMFEKNQNIHFKDYINLTEMVEFEN